MALESLRVRGMNNLVDILTEDSYIKMSDFVEKEVVLE